jgi:hypothetical protein
MFTKVEVKMTIDGHYEGSRRSHNKRKGRCQGKWHKEDESRGIDREMVELRDTTQLHWTICYRRR